MSTFAEQALPHYLECAVWSSNDWDDMDADNPRPLDANYSAHDASPELIASSLEDLTDFIEANAADLEHLNYTAGQLGHDFWLSRNGHGAGFFDRGNDPAYDRLQAAARVYGTLVLYVHDGSLYA